MNMRRSSWNNEIERSGMKKEERKEGEKMRS